MEIGGGGGVSAVVIETDVARGRCYGRLRELKCSRKEENKRIYRFGVKKISPDKFPATAAVAGGIGDRRSSSFRRVFKREREKIHVCVFLLCLKINK